jgi:hypothetical protein
MIMSGNSGCSVAVVQAQQWKSPVLTTGALNTTAVTRCSFRSQQPGQSDSGAETEPVLLIRFDQALTSPECLRRVRSIPWGSEFQSRFAMRSPSVFGHLARMILFTSEIPTFRGAVRIKVLFRPRSGSL